MQPILLAIDKLTVRFGGLWALQNIDLNIRKGEVLGVIGPNGAGKTTLFNVISGIYTPSSGQIQFQDAPLSRPMRPWHVLTMFWVALLCACFALLLASNLDRLWTVVIKQNVRQTAMGQSLPFEIPKAWQAFKTYMRAEPHAEQRMGRFHVVSFDGKTTFASTRDAQQVARLVQDARLKTQDDAAAVRRTRGTVFVGAFLLACSACAFVWRQNIRTCSWIARQGIARTFQNNRLFNNMTVIQNVQVGLDQRLQQQSYQGWVLFAGLYGVWCGSVLAWRFQWLPESVIFAGILTVGLGLGACCVLWLRWRAFTPAQQQLEQLCIQKATELLDFVGLLDCQDVQAAQLSYGHQKRLEIARALASLPQLILLDEPAAGMNHTETAELMALIQRIRERGIAVMLIEHDMKLVMGISDRVAVLEYGRKIAEGTPEQIRSDARVIAAYLGEEELPETLNLASI